MSVMRCDYIVYGVKIPWRDGLSDEGSVSWEYWNDEHKPWKLIVDQMATNYVVFGKVLYENDYYANEAEDKYMDFEEINTQGLDREDFMERYLAVFGEYPKNRDDIKIFAFSHIH